MATHDVSNQPPPRLGRNVYDDDLALREAVEREHAAWAHPELSALGALAGDETWIAHGEAADTFPPRLRTHNRYGHRIDRVDYHPSYHALLTTGVSHGLHAAPWHPDAPPGAHVARAAKCLVWTHVDAGHLCPLSMTYAVVPSLRHQPDLAAAWEARVRSATYDPSDAPAADKAGALFGMAMTEKQGGSDVRTNTTTAEAVEGGDPGTAYALTGHKWFCSAPMSDAFLVLARTGTEDADLSCFLVPRRLPGGERNAFALQRLKDKLGNRSNASSEVEFDGTLGWLVGERGRGIATILEMVAHTRLDCAVGAAASMRKGVVEAAWHVAHRRAFGRYLAEQPLMRTVVADLAVESEAATALALRLARAFDEAGRGNEHAAAFRRLATPVTKYWLCKLAPSHAAEALECLGGNGYVEESGLPRLFRESPLNGIWEGSGNVQCLDALRAMRRSPASVEAVLDEIGAASGADARLDAAARDLRGLLADASEGSARRLVESLAVALQASLLVRFGEPAVADAFVATRLAPGSGRAYGSNTVPVDTAKILARAHPVLAG